MAILPRAAARGSTGGTAERPSTVLPPAVLPPTVLIVEDNDLNRRLFAEVLRFGGLRVIEATDGLSALDIAVRCQLDLVLMDIDLPGLSVLEAMRRLRADPATAAIPILAISAHVCAKTERETLRLGCGGYLAKPVGPDALLAAIERLLPRQRDTGTGQEGG